MNRHRCVISEVRRGFACCHPLFRVRDVIFPRTILIVFARRSPFFFLLPVKKRVTPDVRRNLHIYWAEPDSMQISVKSFPITFPA